MKHIKYFSVFLFILSLLSCKKEEEKMVDVSGIETKTELIRFDRRFYTATPEDLPSLKAEFPYLFPEPNPDSIWTSKMTDKDELFLYESAGKVFGDFSEEKNAIDDLFKHVKHYYPEFKEPKVITILTNVDFNNRVVYADSLLFVSLDVYLGKEHEVYDDYPSYIKQKFTKRHLPVDVAEQLSVPILGSGNFNSFISNIIQEGKRMYLISALLPEVEASEIIAYTEEQLIWAEKSESNIWKYFIENEMLYSNEQSLSDRFIKDAPFSKFYLEVDKDSPGRIGVWFGWQIVNSFMKHNDMGLQEMLVMDNEELFKRSKYKPRKQ
jgi:gliding motility-associated lipoprotein GldB